MKQKSNSYNDRNEVYINQYGFLYDESIWSEKYLLWYAKQIKLTLSEERWKIIRAVREIYIQNNKGWASTFFLARQLTRHFQGEYSQKQLQTLFSSEASKIYYMIPLSAMSGVLSPNIGIESTDPNKDRPYVYKWHPQLMFENNEVINEPNLSVFFNRRWGFWYGNEFLEC